eukprot:scaffold41963_cov54-Phaeocystis_antarctica.AAC.1
MRESMRAPAAELMLLASSSVRELLFVKEIGGRCFELTPSLREAIGEGCGEISGGVRLIHSMAVAITG